MTPQAFLIGRPDFDVDNYLVAAKQALGYSLTLPQGRGKHEPSSVLTMLAQLQNGNATIANTLEDPGHLLRHLHYTFLIACDPSTRVDLIQRTPLAIEYTSTGRGMDMAVLSGNLEEWRTSVINCCSDQSPYQTRLMFDVILVKFEGEGLAKLWSRYQKKTMPDQTIRLIER